MALNTKDDVREMIVSEYSYADTFDKLSDLQGEIADSFMPIYTNEIIAEWVEMPSKFEGNGVAEFGLPDVKDISVTRLMELDLYAYYSSLVAGVIWELEDEGYFDKEEVV